MQLDMIMVQGAVVNISSTQVAAAAGTPNFCFEVSSALCTKVSTSQYSVAVSKAGLLLLLTLQVAVCSLLPLAFCLLGDTAEFYIAPIMAHVSQAIPKMRPRFAGGRRCLLAHEPLAGHPLCC
jgi:hypothetical protein